MESYTTFHWEVVVHPRVLCTSHTYVAYAKPLKMHDAAYDYTA